MRLKHGYRRFANCGFDVIQFILGMATTETTKDRCYCQSKGFKKTHESFSSLSGERSGPCAVRLSTAPVQRYKTEEDAVDEA